MKQVIKQYKPNSLLHNYYQIRQNLIILGWVAVFAVWVTAIYIVAKAALQMG